MKLTAYLLVQPPRASHENMTTMRKVNSFDLIMIASLVADISSRSLKFKFDWTGLKHADPHIAKKTKKVNYILDTLLTEHTRQVFTQASVNFHMRKAEHDIKSIMYPAYCTHHRLRSIRRNKIQPTQNPSEERQSSESGQNTPPSPAVIGSRITVYISFSINDSKRYWTSDATSEMLTLPTETHI